MDVTEQDVRIPCDNGDGVAEYRISGRNLCWICTSEETAGFVDMTDREVDDAIDDLERHLTTPYPVDGR